MTDKQRECLMAFMDDNRTSNKDKVVFLYLYLEGKGVLEDFADHVGEHYQLKSDNLNFEEICDA